ncbi:MAG: DUF1934 domain-containing protein [Oscillospiraceae bacterium]|jgi:uncharacterized beta-barrel protein YwiB (DUF1934 family)|nr:DUF1934 domain-containing protein [Oscillospiraceae bacterium]
MKLNKKNVMIEMISIQSIYNEKTETSLITEGNLRNEGSDSFKITYKDSEATGFDGSTTEIAVTGNSIASIIRTGSTHSDLVIEPGKKHHCHYETPYGEMIVGIYTHKIDNSLTSDGGRLYLKYTIDVNSSYLSDNEIVMNIKNA